MDWVCPAQYEAQWRDTLNTVMELQILYDAGHLLTS